MARSMLLFYNNSCVFAVPGQYCEVVLAIWSRHKTLPVLKAVNGSVVNYCQKHEKLADEGIRTLDLRFTKQ